MIRNYIKIALRGILKNKAYSFLNIVGLAVGMVVQHQPGNMYMGSEMFGVTSAPMADALEQEFPEVIAATRIYRNRNALLSHGEKHFMEPTLIWTDPKTLEIFSLDFIHGDPETALGRPFHHWGNDEAAGLAVTVALFTVSFQTLKASTANPADSLRHE